MNRSQRGGARAALVAAIGVTAVVGTGAIGAAPAQGAHSVSLVALGAYQGGGAAASEIVAYDAPSQRMFITNGATVALDIVDIADPSFPSLVTSVDLTPYGASVQSVAVAGGVVAVAVQPEDRTANGSVVLFETDGTFRSVHLVGVLPDGLTFSPNGRLLVVANEGEPVCDPDDDSLLLADPVGTVSIINVANGSVRTAGFDKWIGKETQLKSQGIRIFFPGSNAAQDLEPEYVAIDRTSRWAYVTLQENNAVAVVYLPTAEVKKLLPLGYQDHLRPGRGLDPSDKDAGAVIAPWRVKGMYQPDSIAVARLQGRDYLVTANEGDARDYDCFSEQKRVKDFTLAQPPYGATDKTDARLGRLRTTSAFPTQIGPGNTIGQVYSYGSRSFSIWTTEGRQVFDSGEQFEQITSTIPGIYNLDGAVVDGRSDDKGPEPEGLAVGRVGSRTYAFVGLERTGGIMVFDITRPQHSTFVQYVPGMNDVSPEGMVFVPADSSPTGGALLLVAHEISGSTRVYAVNPA
jgi:DNA-binding beta-propeller fold protein YncE